MTVWELCEALHGSQWLQRPWKLGALLAAPAVSCLMIGTTAHVQETERLQI